MLLIKAGDVETIPCPTNTLYMYIAQLVSVLDFNFERAVGGSILTAGKKWSLKNLNVTIRAIN